MHILDVLISGSMTDINGEASISTVGYSYRLDVT